MQPPKLLRRLAFVVLVATLACLPAASPGNDVTPTGVDLFEAAPPSPRSRVAAVEDAAVRTRQRVRVRRELLQAPAAVAGNRCKVFPGVATFPAGQDFVRVKVKPKGNAGGPGAKTNVKLTLQPGTATSWGRKPGRR